MHGIFSDCRDKLTCVLIICADAFFVGSLFVIWSFSFQISKGYPSWFPVEIEGWPPMMFDVHVLLVFGVKMMFEWICSQIDHLKLLQLGHFNLCFCWLVIA